MRIRHLFPTTSSRHELDTIPAFLLRNQVGDLLSLYTQRQSRYEGWFIRFEEAFYKLIERIEIVDPQGYALPVTTITNTGASIFWEYENGLKLGWKLLNNLSGLTVRTSATCSLRVILDIRHMYGHPEFGRQYEVREQSGGVLISYRDETLTQSLFMHIRSREPMALLQAWEAVSYPRDAARHSPPEELYVLNLGTVTTSLLGIGYGRTAEEAIRTSLAATKQKPNAPRVGIRHTLDTLVSQVNTARLSVTQSLRWLESPTGLWAGLPWFHQVWSRDELITGLGLNRDLQQTMIRQYLGRELENGELPTYIGSGTTCSDGVGWLCLLVREFGEHNLDLETKERLLQFLSTAHKGLTDYRQAQHGLIRSGYNATWMDTIGREGYPLEIQCMYALLLELLHSLTEDPAYEQERLHMLGTIRQHFWTDTYLADMLNDPVKRPNVFLAYLCQPDLLSQQLWQGCFDTVLEAIKTDWGALASIDHADPRYHPRSTGQDNQSYHNGDTWFFVNHLAAVALLRLNQHRYGKTITGILESSTNEILWHNMIGHPGEIASATTLDSWGCGCQAFSGGTYLMLLKELEGYSNGQSRDSIAFFWDSTAASTKESFFK